MTIKKKIPSVAVDAAVAAGTGRPLVRPDSQNCKSGCLYCPLMPFHLGFSDYAGRYMRDAAKIVAKEREGHKVRNRNVTEPWTEVDILFVGEAPGAEEDGKGLPFVGRSGNLLRTTIDEIMPTVWPGFSKERVGFANVVRCRPPRNRDPNKTEMVSCGPDLIREIKARKPKLLVATGNKALEFLCDQSGITMLNGRFLKTTHPDLPEMDVMGCLHPAYILRMDHELQRFADSIERAAIFAAGDYKPLKGLGEYFVLDTIAQVRQLFDDFRKKPDRPVAFDTETGSLQVFQLQFPALLCLSFAQEEGVGYTIPFDHAESPWRVGGLKERERPQLIRLLREFFIDTRLQRLAQNEKFDRKHIRKAIGVELGLTTHDTMSKHLTIDERRGTHGLKVLAFQFTGMGGYEKPLDDYKDRHRDCDPDKGGSYANIPGDVLFRYAAMDADCTVRVNNGLTAHEAFANNERFQRLANAFFPKLSAVLAKMEYAGATVDLAIVDKLDAKYQGEMDVAEAKIKVVPEVVSFVAKQREIKGPTFEFNPGSTKQLAVVLFDLYGLRPTELTDRGFEIAVARHKRVNDAAKDAFEKAVAERTAKIKKGEKVGPPPRSPEPIKFGAVISAAIDKREWDLFTTNAECLHEFERQGNKLATTILEYRAAQTLHGTFVVPLKYLLDEQRRVHGNFNIIGTVTGRLSSDDPNLQNIPNKGGGLIKQAYVSRFGNSGIIVNVDFSQIELRVAAAWFKEPKMREVYLRKQDLHKLTASVIAGLSMEAFNKLPKDKQKEWRTRAKRVNFGVLYGGGPPALQSTLKKDGVFVTLDECQVFIDKFFKAYPGLRRGMDKLEASVMKLGYLESFTGRRRRVPEVFSEDQELRARAIRQCINFPIQSGAGDMTLMALCVIDEIMTREKFQSVPILTVHDSLVFDCHVDEAVAVAKLAKDVMENIPHLSEDVLPGLDWSWLDVPIVAECDMGVNWGMMVEFEPDVLLGEAEGDDADKPLFGKNDKGKDDLMRKPVNIDEMWEAFAFKAQKAVA